MTLHYRGWLIALFIFILFSVWWVVDSRLYDKDLDKDQRNGEEGLRY